MANLPTIVKNEKVHFCRFTDGRAGSSFSEAVHLDGFSNIRVKAVDVHNILSSSEVTLVFVSSNEIFFHLDFNSIQHNQY